MLATIQFAMQAVADLVVALAIPLQVASLIRERRKGRYEFAGWSLADRKLTRACSAIMWGGVVVAWAAVPATVAHQPALIRDPSLIGIVFLPLIVTFMSATWSAPKVLENLRRSRSFRTFMFSGMLAALFVFAASLLTLFNAGTAHL